MGEGEAMAKFNDVAIGTPIRLENFWGTKVEPIFTEGSTEFYRKHGTTFYGWNFKYKFHGFGEESYCSLAPDCEVVVLSQLPSCY